MELKIDLNAQRRTLGGANFYWEAWMGGDYTIAKIPDQTLVVLNEIVKCRNGFRGIFDGRVYVDFSVPRCILFLTFHGSLHARVST